MYEQIKKRLWWILLLLVIALIIGITNNLDGQDKNVISVDIYNNGKMVMLDTTEICFIYGDRPFGLSGNTLKILIRKE